jgi:hypothetical protein
LMKKGTLKKRNQKDIGMKQQSRKL